MKSILNKELEDKIIQLAEEEGYISIIAGKLEIPRTTLQTWLSTNEILRHRFINARGRLASYYKDEMIRASRDKKHSDWRVYESLLGTLDKEFSKYKWKDSMTPESVQQINFIFQDSAKGIERARGILSNFPRAKVLQDDDVRLIEDEREEKT